MGFPRIRGDVPSGGDIAVVLVEFPRIRGDVPGLVEVAEYRA